MTDTATYSGERVSVHIRLGIPAKSSRSPGRPGDGERRLLRFILLLQQERLIKPSEQGALSDDGMRFGFTLRQYPTRQRLNQVCDVYRAATSRELKFVTEPNGKDTAEAASEGVDWSALFGQALTALQRLNPFD